VTVAEEEKVIYTVRDVDGLTIHISPDFDVVMTENRFGRKIVTIQGRDPYFVAEDSKGRRTPVPNPIEEEEC